jgi:hypothetical protein
MFSSTKGVRKVIEGQPEVDFIVGGSGVTIYSSRFYEPRFLEWDVKGKCPKCKSSIVDIDFFVSGNGIELHSSRFNVERFVFFDIPYQLPDQCHFRVRMKGHTYTIPFEKNKVVIKTKDGDEIKLATKEKINSKTVKPEDELKLSTKDKEKPKNIKTKPENENQMEIEKITVKEKTTQTNI